MSKIKPHMPHVVVYRAHVSKTTIEGRDGLTIVDHDPPQPTYFVDYMEDGCRCGDWQGPLHRMAMDAAKEWGVPIFDLTDRGERS